MREQATRETHYEFGPLDRNERTALRDVKKTLIKALSPLSLARAEDTSPPPDAARRAPHNLSPIRQDLMASQVH